MARGLLSLVVWSLLVGAIPFGTAGTLRYPGGWAFLALFLIGGAASITWMARHDPALLRERLAPPVQREQRPWDRALLLVFVLLFMGWLAFMAWGARRTGFEAVPLVLQALGALLVAGYMIGAVRVFRENTFAAPVVKIQADQRVIDSGPYALVRHPLYSCVLLLFFGLPLLLGSWSGLIGSALLTVGVAARSVGEQRTLRAELPGYDAYAARVRSRLVPGLW